MDHPAVFPLALAEQLIRTFSQAGDLVLDPFCGSGQTLLAAKGCGRRYLGIEREDEVRQDRSGAAAAMRSSANRLLEAHRGTSFTAQLQLRPRADRAAQGDPGVPGNRRQRQGAGKARDEEIRYGKSVQEDILLLLSDMDGRRVYHDRDEFRKLLESVFKGLIRIPAVLLGRDDGRPVRGGVNALAAGWASYLGIEGRVRDAGRQGA